LGSLVGDTSIRVIQNANLIAFVSKAFDFGFRFDLERDTDAEPVSAFARLSEGNIDVTNDSRLDEAALASSRLAPTLVADLSRWSVTGLVPVRVTPSANLATSQA